MFEDVEGIAFCGLRNRSIRIARALQGKPLLLLKLFDAHNHKQKLQPRFNTIESLEISNFSSGSERETEKGCVMECRFADKLRWHS